MLGTYLCLRTVSSFVGVIDQVNAITPPRSISNSLTCSSSQLGFGFFGKNKDFRKLNSIFVISCKASRSHDGCYGGGSSFDNESEDQFLEASVLISETVRHYQLRRQGFHEDMTWQSGGFPFSSQPRELRTDTSLGHDFLLRFQSPTIFLKISFDGDLLLPIIVGEFAIEKLIDALHDDEIEDCPNQYQFVSNLVGNLGYEVNMVRITQRVASTYFARIYFSKHGDTDIFSVDARPSDAINVAERCKVPIYVSKQIVFTDAIRIGYGTGRVRETKSCYDVSLDSAADDPDTLAEELSLVRNMKLAVKEERYRDAAIWRDKLTDLRKTKDEP
ncbi:UVR domain [Dillenia turbinata]|uniref:UVR domain n=1 Tax=Dillenia turbinata TaxID=194707 RepID=A0AAN8V3B2_9MAGN